jgi:molybdopterin biosynthesis enzyme
VSSIVCFHLFVKPAVHKLAGRPEAPLPRVHAKLGFPIELDRERPEYHRVILTWHGPIANKGGDCFASENGHFLAESTGGQRSSRLLSMRSAAGLLELPQGRTRQKPAASAIDHDDRETTSWAMPGDIVSCILIGDLRNMLQHGKASTT